MMHCFSFMIYFAEQFLLNKISFKLTVKVVMMPFLFGRLFRAWCGYHFVKVHFQLEHRRGGWKS